MHPSPSGEGGRPAAEHRRRVRWLATAVVAVALLVAGLLAVRPTSGGTPGGGARGGGRVTAGSPPGTPSPEDSPPDQPVAGAAGLGDPVFPGLGNGGYQVDHYDLALRYDAAPVGALTGGTVTARATATRALSRFDLDFAGRSVGAVTVDGEPAGAERRGEELVVTPARPLQRGQQFTVTVRDVVPAPAASRDDQLDAALFAGPDGTVWAGQPANAHQLFPSNDHPVDKATFSFRIDVPAGTTAVANGDLTGSSTAGGRTTWRYEQREPMATELAQVACGRFTVTSRGQVGGVTVRDVTPTRLTSTIAPQLAEEVQELQWMQARVGPYPFRSFGSLVADVSIGFSALETQTLILYGTPPFTPAASSGDRASVMVHELAHQWFGDSVSPASWADVWLSEGHATWYEYLYDAEHGTAMSPTDDAGSLEERMHRLYQRGNDWRRASGGVAAPTAHTAKALFSPNVYTGGALVLYALRQEIGVPAFERLEREWVSRYRGRSAGTRDFVALAGEVAGRDVSGFLHDWLYGTTMPPMPGHPDWVADR